MLTCRSAEQGMFMCAGNKGAVRIQGQSGREERTAPLQASFSTEHATYPTRPCPESLAIHRKACAVARAGHPFATGSNPARENQRPWDRRRTTTPAAFMPNTEVTKATLPSI